MAQAPKPGYVRAQALTGRYQYFNTRTWKEVTASEALGGAVTESHRTELNESGDDRLVDSFRELGLSKKEAKLAAGSQNGNGSKSSKKTIRESYRALGLSKKEAKLAEKRGR